MTRAVTRAVLAEFTRAEAFEDAWRQAQAEGFRTVDSFTPYPPPEDEAAKAAVRGVIRNAIIAGLVFAGLLYAVEVLSAVLAYPFDSGGRPYNSWPVFPPAAFELGVLTGSVAGFLTFLWHARLPHLSDPVFDAPGVERASQDRWFLALTPVEGAAALAMRLGALRTSEVEL